MYSVSLGVLYFFFFLFSFQSSQIGWKLSAGQDQSTLQAVASTPKLTQIGAVSTTTTGRTCKDLGFIFPYPSQHFEYD